MLILKFSDEREAVKKPKRWFRNNLKNKEFKRYTITVDGKPVTVLELGKDDLQSEDVLTLLKINRGKVLVPQEYANEELLTEFLYNPKEYYQRALLSSLINQVKSVNKDWKNFSIKIEEFLPHKELYELVRISKTVTIITHSNSFTERFSKECYYEYGAIVSIKDDVLSQKSDVFIELDAIDDKGKLMINVNGKDFLLYPDMRYFENCDDYEKLIPFNLGNNIVCSAFSAK